MRFLCFCFWFWIGFLPSAALIAAAAACAASLPVIRLLPAFPALHALGTFFFFFGFLLPPLFTFNYFYPDEMPAHVCVCVWVSCWTGELVCERFANSLKLSLSLPFLPAVVLTSCGESVGTGGPGPGVGVCQCVSRAPAECTSWYPATYRSVRRCCFVTPLTLPALCAH